MSDIHGELGPKQKKNKLKKQNQKPSRFLGKVDEFGNIDAVLIEPNDKNVEKEVPEAKNSGNQAESGFWFSEQFVPNSK